MFCSLVAPCDYVERTMGQPLCPSVGSDARDHKRKALNMFDANNLRLAALLLDFVTTT